VLRERDGEVEVEIRGAAPRLGGYRIVATLHHEGGETTLEPVPGEEDLEDSEWAAADPWCEHCAVRRRRHVTYLLRRDHELVQVGSSCLGDFAGEHDPARAARQAQLLAQARRETAGRGLIVDEAPGDLAPLGGFLSWVCELAAHHGFRSRQRARENGVEATGDHAWERMRGGRAPPAAMATARAVIRWARNDLAELVDRSEYEDRLVWALARPRLGYAERYRVATALGAYLRSREPPLAEPGERFEAEVWVELAARKGRPRRFGRSYFHRFRDGFGRLIVWYATDRRLERGGRYRLRGTVRRQAELGDERATVVHRCRVREP
jgi:hypothetical protein